MHSQKTWMETSSKVRSGTGSKESTCGVVGVEMAQLVGIGLYYGFDMVDGPEYCLFCSHMSLMCYSVPPESGLLARGRKMKVGKAVPHCRTVRLGGPRIAPPSLCPGAVIG